MNYDDLITPAARDSKSLGGSTELSAVKANLEKSYDGEPKVNLFFESTDPSLSPKVSSKYILLYIVFQSFYASGLNGLWAYDI